MKIRIFALILIANTSLAESVAEKGAIKPEPESSAEGAPITGMQNSGGRTKRTTLPNRVTDGRVQNVLNNLVKQAEWFPNISVSVDQGVVTIKGTVKNAEHLRWLAETADRIPSVLAVINQAKVETPPVSDFTPAVNEFRELVESAKKKMPLIGVAIILALVFYFVGKYAQLGINKLWGRHINNPFLLSTVARLTMLPIWVLFFYLILRRLW